MKKNILLVVIVIAAGVLFGLLGPATADKSDRGPKPSQKAIDQIRGKLVSPDALDPASVRGQARPDAPGLALILRDPTTGDVLREADGKPKLARNPDGSVAMLTPDQIPPEQTAAQAKHQEKVTRAEKGDAKAKAELDADTRKTTDATKNR